MKSQKRMHEECTGFVRRIGPRKDEEGRFGYFLTIAQIKEIYFENGFSKRSTRTIPSHISAWAYVGWVGYDQDADLSDEKTTIWWPCLTDKTALTIAAERYLADPAKLVLEPPAVDFGGE